jgi:ATP-dependent RNA helicase SUPV3L1/SUV3
LIASLEEPAPLRGLVKARPAMDLASLRILAASDEFAAMAHAPAAVKRMWDACQLPDFRKLSADEHVKLVAQIYRYLMSADGVLPEDWFARQIARLDEIEGDVATLSGRLAQIRTWTYATHRPGWLKDSGHWQEQTRAVEDRLSDVLHERLTQRFIDRRTAVLMRSLRDDETVSLTLDDSGAVSIAGEPVGKLEGFRFTADARAEGIHGRTLRAAAFKGLEGEFQARTQRLATAADAAITLSEHGRLWWDGAVVATLEAGASALAPRVAIHADEQLRGDLRAQIQTRLDDWLAARIAARLEPLIALRAAADAKPGTKQALPAQARGLAHQLCEALGSLDRGGALLPPDERAAQRALRPLGVRFARRSIYLPKLIRPDAAALLALLWAVKHRLAKIPPPPNAGITSFETEPGTPKGFIAAAGFRIIGPRAIRIDMLDRLEQELEAAAASGATADAAIPKLVSLLGSDRATLEAVLADLGWSRVEVANAETPTNVWRHGRPQMRRRGREKQNRAVVNSPFADLQKLANKYAK